MPLAGMVGAETQRLEHVWQQSRPARSIASFEAGERVASNLLSVVTSQQCSACRPAASCVVELRKPQAVRRQSVQVGRRDLATVAADVRITEIIGENDQDIRSLRGCFDAACERERDKNARQGQRCLHNNAPMRCRPVDSSELVGHRKSSFLLIVILLLILLTSPACNG